MDFQIEVENMTFKVYLISAIQEKIEGINAFYTDVILETTLPKFE
ncbi:MAG: hypothetical protein ACI86C_000780 [Candidatus Latescibacterota bacterium]|jgi:hypothetical protein